MKVVQWTSVPCHIQSGFQHALRQAGVDLKVCYYEGVTPARLGMGWSAGEHLPPGEQFVRPMLESLKAIPDWRDRVHLVPGASRSFLRQLIRHLSREKAEWAHWSECANPGLRWYISFPVKRWLAAMINRHALGAFAQGWLAFRDFERWGVDPCRISFLPYSTSPADQAAQPDPESREFARGRKTFLFLGSLCRRKGIDIILSSFARVAPISDDWVLLLVGDDRGNGRYQRQASRLGIGDRVLFRGPMPPSSLSNAMATADVLLLPSRLDGWGVTLNEGASMGLPLIGSTAGGSAYHLIQPGENGFRVKPGSTDSLASAMVTYMRDPSLIQRHGARSLEIFQEVAPERTAQRFLADIESWRAMTRRANP